MVDRYAHFVDEMRKDAATKMDAILNPVAVSVAVKQPEPKMPAKLSVEVLKNTGATRRDRTGDLLITNQPLYQLS